MLKVGDEVRIRRKKDLLCEYSYNCQEDERLLPEISDVSFRSTLNRTTDGLNNITEIGGRGVGDTGKYMLNEAQCWTWTEYMLETLDGKKL